MATPIGHLLAGAAVGAAFNIRGDTRRSASTGALAGLCADLDFIPGALMGDPSRFHHAASHSFLFVILAFGIGWLLTRKKRLRWGALTALAYSSHLLLDFFTMDCSPPRGIPLLWPVSMQAFLSPVTLLPKVHHTSAFFLSAHNFRLAGFEIIFFGSLLALAIVSARRLRNKSLPGSTT